MATFFFLESYSLCIKSVMLSQLILFSKKPSSFLTKNITDIHEYDYLKTFSHVLKCRKELLISTSAKTNCLSSLPKHPYPT